jgi:hypothetical protein
MDAAKTVCGLKTQLAVEVSSAEQRNMNEVRIREPRQPRPGEQVVTFWWRNPPSPKPRPNPSAKFEAMQAKLNGDPRRFKARAEFAGWCG